MSATDLTHLVEQGLEKYLTPFLTAGLEPGDAAPLEGAQILRGHSDARQDAQKPAIICTASRFGGPLAYAGNFDAQVQIRIETGNDDQGMTVHARLVGSIAGLLAPEHTEAVLAALRSIAGLGVSCYEFDHGTGTQEARDKDRRRHGTALPYVFLVHRV